MIRVLGLVNDNRSSRRPGFWQRDGVFLALLLFIFAARYLAPLAHGNLFAPFQDTVWLFGPLFSRTALIALHGSYPFWIDSILTGLPLYNTPHFSTTYPFYFFGVLNYGIESDAVTTLTRLTVFHLFILALNSYVMLRAAGSGGFGALCGATVSLISGTTSAYSGWMEVVASYSWFPLLIAGAILVLCKPGVLSTLLFTLSATFLTLANPAQPVIHAFIFCVLFFFAGLIYTYKAEGRYRVLQISGCLLIAFATCATLTAVATVPMTLDMPDLIRHIGLRNLAVVGGERIPWEAFKQLQLRAQDLYHIFFDSRYLGIIGGPYVGPLGLAGVVFCVIGFSSAGTFRKFLVAISAFLACYGLLAALGTQTGVTQLHYHLPLLNRIREAGRHLILFTTFVSLLAGLGFDSAQTFFARRHFGRLTWYFVGIGAVLCCAAFIAESSVTHRVYTGGWLPLFAIPIGLILFRAAGIPVGVINTLGLVFCSVAASVADDGTHASYLSSYYDRANLEALRFIRRVADLPGISDCRVAYRGAAFSPGYWGMDASFHNIRSFYAYMTPVPYAQFQDMNREHLPHYRELMGARYVVCGEDGRPRNGSDKLLFTDANYRVYEIANPMQQVTLIHDVAGTYRSDSQFFSIIGTGFDYNRTVYVPDSEYKQVTTFLASKSPITPNIKGDFVQVTHADSNRRVVISEADRPGLLVLNEYHNKAWHALVNGKKNPLRRVNLNQMAVLLPPGHSVVEFYYGPVLFKKLLVVQRMMFAAIIGLCALYLVRRHKARSYAPFQRG